MALLSKGLYFPFTGARFVQNTERICVVLLTILSNITLFLSTIVFGIFFVLLEAEKDMAKCINHDNWQEI